MTAFEEAVEKHNQYHENQALAAQITEHENTDLYESLTQSQAETLLGLFASFTDTSLGNMLAAMHLGRLREVIRVRFNKCPCGALHQDPNDLLRDSTLSTAQTPLSTEEQELANAYTADAKRNELMKRYRVTADGSQRGVYCTDCMMKYISLSDRMVRDPDDCPGCHLKSSQG